MDKKILINILGLAFLGTQAQSPNLRVAADFQALDSLTTQWLDPGTNTWQPSGSKIQKYDAQGRLIEESKYDIRAGQRHLLSWSKIEFNDGEKVAARTDKTYLGDTLYSIVQHEYTYNDQGFFSMDIISGSNSESKPLEFKSKVENIYENGKFIEEIHYSFEDGVWVAKTKKAYSFNISGKVDQIKEYHFTESEVWSESNSKVKFSYGGGRIVNRVDSARQSASSPWYAKAKYDYVFDKFGNLKSETLYVWNSDSNKLVGDYIYEYVVDTTATFSGIYVSDLVKEKSNNKLDSIVFYDYNDGRWVLTEVTKPQYAAFVPTPVVDDQLGTATLYLDTESQTLKVINAANFAGAKIALFDVQGRNVLSQDMNANGVSIQPLQTGIYVYRFSHNGHTSSGRLVK